MAKRGFTAEELLSTGGKPVGRGFTLEELQSDQPLPTEEPRKKQGVFSRAFGALQTAGAVGRGFGKGAISTVAGASALGEQFLSFGRTKRGETLGAKAQEAFRPEGTAEKVGFGIEQAAEFAVPGTAPTKLARAVTGVGRAAKAIGLGARVGAEALVAGGQAAIQKGGLDEDVALTAALGGGIPFAGAIGGKATKALSGRIVNSLIKPLKRAMAYGKNPGRGVAKEGIVANTFDELEKRVVAKKSEIGAAIGAKIKEAPEGTVIDLSDIFKPIDDAVVQASKAKRTKSGVLARLKDAKNDLAEFLGMKVDEETGEAVLDLAVLSKVDPQKTFDFKTVTADITRFTGNPSDDEAVNAALKGVYGKLKGGLNNKIKGLDELNERFADMVGADVAIKNRGDILQRQNVIFGFTPQVTGGFSAVIAGLATGQAITGLAVGAAMGLASKAAGSVPVKLRFAKVIASLGPDDRRKAVLGTLASKRFFEILFGTNDPDEIANFSD